MCELLTGKVPFHQAKTMVADSHNQSIAVDYSAAVQEDLQSMCTSFEGLLDSVDPTIQQKNVIAVDNILCLLSFCAGVRTESDSCAD